MIGGFIYGKGRLRRTSWGLSIGEKRKAYYGGAKEPQNQYDYCRRKVLTHGLRIVEWPWSGGQIQWYWGERKVIAVCWGYEKKKIWIEKCKH